MSETGVITCLKIRECPKKAPPPDINQLLQASLNGIDLDAEKKKDEYIESDHEVFIGFETGAVGMFRIWLKSLVVPEGADPETHPSIEIELMVYIAPQKITAEMECKHVLAMLPMECSNPKLVNSSKDFKLAVGYNAMPV